MHHDPSSLLPFPYYRRGRENLPSPNLTMHSHHSQSHYTSYTLTCPLQPGDRENNKEACFRVCSGNFFSPIYAWDVIVSLCPLIRQSLYRPVQTSHYGPILDTMG